VSLIAPPSHAALSAIGRRFEVEPNAIHPLPSGEANHAFRLGDDLILRIPQNDGQLAADLLKERIVIPVARSNGVLTPEIVAFDGSGADIAAPYLVSRRVSGTDLERAAMRADQVMPIYREVGRNLALLHAATVGGKGVPAGVPVDDGGDDPCALLDPLVRDRALDPDSSQWLRSWFERLAPSVPEEPVPVLIHGDIAPRNLLADPETGRLTGLVDWGDAALADPAMDFAKLPLTVLPAALEGYLGQDDWSGAGLRSWLARAFRYQLHWAVAALGRRDPATGDLLPPGPAMARLMVVLRHLIDSADGPWRWLREGPDETSRSFIG